MYNLMYNGDVLMSLQLSCADPCFVEFCDDCDKADLLSVSYRYYEFVCCCLEPFLDLKIMI